MKALFAILCSALLSGCADSSRALRETRLSELFDVCVHAPHDAQVLREAPVDLERIVYGEMGVTYRIVLSHYQGDQSHFKGPIVKLGGPLDVVVLGTIPDEKGETYAISLDSLGAVQPRAFGSISITSGTEASVDELHSFLVAWHRCEQSL